MFLLIVDFALMQAKLIHYLSLLLVSINGWYTFPSHIGKRRRGIYFPFILLEIEFNYEIN